MLKRVMEDINVSLNAYTYSVLINGFCKNSRLDDANLLFDEMCDRGLVPNDVIFTNSIDGNCRHGRVGFDYAACEIVLDYALIIYAMKKG